MKPVVVAKILQEAFRASWNFSSVHRLHHPMNVKNQILILKIEIGPIFFQRLSSLDQFERQSQRTKKYSQTSQTSNGFFRSDSDPDVFSEKLTYKVNYREIPNRDVLIWNICFM